MSEGDIKPGAPKARPAPYRLLDVWRGIASLAVVAYHWAGVAVYGAPALADNALYRASEYGFLGVQLFFVISGFCIVASAVGLLRKFEARTGAGDVRSWATGLLSAYFIARARRIYPTYWAGLALVLLFSWFATQMARAGRIPENIYTHFDAAHLPLSTVFANITLLAVPLHQELLLSVAWTLCYEVAFYAIIGAALAGAIWLAPKRRQASGEELIALLLNLLHGVTLGSLLFLCVAPSWVPFPLELWPQFGLGVLLYDVLMNGNPARKRVAGFGLGGALFVLMVFVVLHDVTVGAMGQPARLSFLTSGGFTLVLLVLYRHDAFLANKWVIRALGWVGLFSYSLYLTHTITIRIAGQLLQRAHLFPRFHLLVFALVLAIAVGAAYIFFVLFEKPLLSRRKIEREPVP